MARTRRNQEKVFEKESDITIEDPVDEPVEEEVDIKNEPTLYEPMEEEKVNVKRANTVYESIEEEEAVITKRLKIILLVNGKRPKQFASQQPASAPKCTKLILLVNGKGPGEFDWQQPATIAKRQKRAKRKQKRKVLAQKNRILDKKLEISIQLIRRAILQRQKPAPAGPKLYTRSYNKFKRLAKKGSLENLSVHASTTHRRRSLRTVKMRNEKAS